MEDTRYNLDQVHVLRQGFMPNEPFEKALSSLVVPGANNDHPYTIYGSDERTLELDEVRSKEFGLEKLAADKFLAENQYVHLSLKDKVSARVLMAGEENAVALQLIMNPLRTEEFAHNSEALSMISGGTKGYALGFQATRLYMDIPFNHLRPIGEVKKNFSLINEVVRSEARRRIYQVTPLPQLLGRFVHKRQQETKYTSHPESRAS